MTNFLKNIFKKKDPVLLPGALDDPRPYEDRISDKKFEETVAQINPVKWVEKSISEWRRFSIRNQDGSGSCVAQTIAKLCEILWFLLTGERVQYSAADPYQKRSNKSSSGMNYGDVPTVTKDGVTLEVLMPSQNMSESEINSATRTKMADKISKVFPLGDWLQMQFDIETIASVIQTTGKGVMVWFKFNYPDWTDIPTVATANPQYGHSVTAVDFTLYKGKKYLVIEDSWGKFGLFDGQRLISQEFIKARMFLAAYPINFRNEEEKRPTKPIHTFSKELRFSPSYSTDPDVVALQDCLKYLGIFPTNIASTGYYGAITAQYVLEFQKQYGVSDMATLDKLGGRVVGPSTLAKLNELFNA
jgi:hypothetical protein